MEAMATLEEVFALGWKHQQAGDLTQAERCYRDLLRTDPENARTWFVLGTACQAQHKSAEAEACFRQAVRLKPGEADGYHYLAGALLEQGKQDEAGIYYRRCLELKPDHAEAMTNLGFVLSEQGKVAEAQALYERAVQIKPHYAEVHHNLGNVLREQNKLPEAVACYQRALQLKPDYVKALINLGIALVALGKPAEAVPLMERALELQPDFYEAFNSLGAARSTMGDLQGAAAAYQRALALKPDYAEAHWNLSLLLLLWGKFAEGWSEYEWRWQCKKNTPLPPFSQPVWDGAPLDGKTILLQEEQGLGDTLHFIRYARLVKQRGGKVIVYCPRGLTQLLRTCPGIDGLVEKGAAPPDFDVRVPLLSLPRILQTTKTTIPAEVPYLFAHPALVEHWRRELAALRGLRIGIAWQGNPNHPWDRHRSVPLACFEPLARVPGAQLISLQKGPGTDQLEALAGRFPVISLGGQVDETAGKLMDTAAIMKNLDLVVAADTAIAHLAGALGVPVWVALCYTPDWRWLLDRDDSPWYPSMRLFRQRTLGNWREVFEQMADIMHRRPVQSNRSRSVAIEIAPGELIDKITILEIKTERMTDLAKLSHVREELLALTGARDTQLPPSPELTELAGRLKTVNESLWQIEDQIRSCERDHDFGPRFIELARSVYKQNDERAALKRRINDLLGARLVEEKSSAAY
jgi:tetratricopeptide (TPR) repeat protein